MWLVGREDGIPTVLFWALVGILVGGKRFLSTKLVGNLVVIFNYKIVTHFVMIGSSLFYLK